MEAKKKKGLKGLTLTPLKHPIMRTPLMLAHSIKKEEPTPQEYHERFLDWAESQEPGFRDYLLSLADSGRVRKLA